MSMTWFRSRRDDRNARRRQDRRRRFSVEMMEGRQMLSTFTVTSTADGGTGSLRAAITQSNQTPGANTIDFAVPGNYLHTISLQSALPTITNPVTIDGTSEGGYSGNPMIILDGSGAGASADGLTIEAADVTVRGLAIDSFAGDGIVVVGGNADVIDSDVVGLTPAGLVGPSGLLATSGNAPAGNFSGVVVESSADVTISNSVISANRQYGINLVNTSDSTIEGDRVGTDSGGTTATAYNGSSLGNGIIGVLVDIGSTDNTIGGTSPAALDIISGNTIYGVYISGASTSGNVVEGDFIGTDYTGTVAVGNDDGVDVAYGATNNTIGGTTAAARNIISGNSGDGIQLSTSGPGDVIEGDFIGTSVTGDSALGNGRSGVTVQYGASGDLIGGTTPGAAVVISGNNANGIWFLAAGGDTVEGDLIGTDPTGTTRIPNGGNGVALVAGSSSNTIGGTTAADRNVISGNSGSGVVLSDSGTQYNVVQNDFIGTNATGRFAISNGGDGVLVENGASINALSYDVISGNGVDNVLFTGATTSYNYVIDSKIGLNAAGTGAVSNFGDQVGVQITNGANGTTVDFDTISGNVIGVEIDGSSTNNAIEEDLIGTDATGQYNVGNAEIGVFLNQTSGNYVAYCSIDYSGEAGLVYYYSAPGQDTGNSYAGNALDTLTI